MAKPIPAPTAEQLRRRARCNRYAREARARKLDRQRARAETCPFKQGAHGVCGAKLEIEVDRYGRTVSRCPRCERRLAGICQDCPRRVVGRVGSALRCAECKRRARRGFQRKYRDRDPARYKEKWRAFVARRRADPVKRARDLAVKKAWRQRNLVKIKLEKRQWRLDPNRPGGYSSREKWAAYHAAYRAKHAARRRELAKQQYYRLHPARPHPICGCGCEAAIPWDGRGRPAKWLRGHSPWHHHTATPKETIMTAASRAITMLERAAEKVRQKLEGTKALQEELAAIERAVKELKTVASADAAPRTRRKKAA